MATRCFSPRRNVGGYSLRKWLIPQRSNTSSTMCVTSSLERPKDSGPNATSVATVGLNIWRSGCWNTYPINWPRLDGGMDVISLPL